MSDILIRDVPDDVVAAVDSRAQRAGISRSEYLRRVLARERDATPVAMTIADLEWFADAFADLTDDDVMGAAWR